MGQIAKDVAKHLNVWRLMKMVPDAVWVDLFILAKLSGGKKRNYNFRKMIMDFHEKLDKGEIKLKSGRVLTGKALEKYESEHKNDTFPNNIKG